MDSIATVAGWLLIGWGIIEVFTAVLFPRSLSPPLGGLLCQLSQRLAATIWRSWPCRLRPAITLIGPALVTAQILTWALLLWIGFSLIVWPQLGVSIVASGSGGTPTDFVSAMYATGFSLTTLGVGDLVPKTAGMQLLMVAQAAIGFSYFTLVLTYVMSVYSALTFRNRLALSIDCHTRCTGNPYIYLISSLDLPADSAVRTADELADGLLAVYESHQFYPVLHYFRFPEAAYALPRMLYCCLEIATVAEATRAVAGSDVATPPFGPTGRLWLAANRLLGEAEVNFSRHESGEFQKSDLPESFHDFVRELQSRSGRLNTDADALAQRYRELRESWTASLAAVARSQGAEEMMTPQLEGNGFGRDRCEQKARGC